MGSILTQTTDTTRRKTLSHPVRAERVYGVQQVVGRHVDPLRGRFRSH